jgi:hypothetical protein
MPPARIVELGQKLALADRLAGMDGNEVRRPVISGAMRISV